MNTIIILTPLALIAFLTWYSIDFNIREKSHFIGWYLEASKLERLYYKLFINR